jgi:hypothetical protein
MTKIYPETSTRATVQRAAGWCKAVGQAEKSPPVTRKIGQSSSQEPQGCKRTGKRPLLRG